MKWYLYPKRQKFDIKLTLKVKVTNHKVNKYSSIIEWKVYHVVHSQKKAVAHRFFPEDIYYLDLYNLIFDWLISFII